MKNIVLYISIILIILILCILIIAEIPRYIVVKQYDNLEYYDKYYSSVPRVNSNNKVVITLTTIPDRINLMKPTIISLLSQNVRVDEIAINIPYTSRKGNPYIIPNWLINTTNIKIYRVGEDLGPITKIIPTLQREEENTRIIVVDDDIIHHTNNINTLVKMFEQHNGRYAFTNYGVRLTKKYEDMVNTPLKDKIRAVFGSSIETNILRGFSGYIITPRMFPEQFYDLSSAPREAISVDDTYISGWLCYNNVKIYTTGHYYSRLSFVAMKMLDTTMLTSGENSSFDRDIKTIEWFRENYNVFV